MADGGQTEERYGRLVRRFPVAVSAGAMAGAWARQEDAPAGSTVVVDHEISPLGRLGESWTARLTESLCMATVLRPSVPPEDADVSWLVAGLGAMTGAEAVSGVELSAWWPERIVDAATGETRVAVKAEIQLGAAHVRSAVVVLRFDLTALGLPVERREELLESVVNALDAAAAGLEEGPETAAAAYGRRCLLVDRRVKLRLMPKGEARGTVRGFDGSGRMELTSGTGMIERISVDMLRELQLA